MTAVASARALDAPTGEDDAAAAMIMAIALAAGIAAPLEPIALSIGLASATVIRPACGDYGIAQIAYFYRVMRV